MLVVCKDEMTYKHLQQQFIRHEVEKTYEAWVEGDVEGDSGKISLRMRRDASDPPRQLVDMEHGKNSVTRWKVLEHKGGMTHLELYPDTGRTHQLRVHCAHPLGLNAPIVGDKLYGNQSATGNLRLRATRLKLNLYGEDIYISI